MGTIVSILANLSAAAKEIVLPLRSPCRTLCRQLWPVLNAHNRSWPIQQWQSRMRQQISIVAQLYAVYFQLLQFPSCDNLLLSYYIWPRMCSSSLQLKVEIWVWRTSLYHRTIAYLIKYPIVCFPFPTPMHRKQQHQSTNTWTYTQPAIGFVRFASSSYK